MQNTENIQQFENLLQSINRQGIPEIIKYIQSTDFYTAPASTKFHSACEGGLLQHSLNVYTMLTNEANLTPNANNISKDSLIITALLHDICKANLYATEMRNVKENGSWVQKPYYVVNDKFPFGHGEKSVYIINCFTRLTKDEALAIRWHMGGFDETVRGGNFTIGNAFEMCTLAVLLHCADLKATYLLESQS